MKIVINKCFGGFGLSYEGMMAYAKLKKIKLFGYVEELGNWRERKKETYHSYKSGEDAYCIHYCTRKLKNKHDKKTLNKYYLSEYDIKRDDPALIKVVELLKDKANGRCAELKVVTIPDGTEYEIDEYDGTESIHEKHRAWG